MCNNSLINLRNDVYRARAYLNYSKYQDAMETPKTPLHPRGDEEIREIPQAYLPEGTIADLNLNPGLYDDDSGESNSEGEYKKPQVGDGNQTENLITTSKEGIDKEDYYEIEPLTCSFQKEIETLTEEVSTRADQVKEDFQKSRLINYIDERFLVIQRNYKRSRSSVTELYSLLTLLSDLSKLVDIIWHSINTYSGLFGQDDCLIRILGDLEDYVYPYSMFEDLSDLDALKRQLQHYFQFFQRLDTILSLLIDGVPQKYHGPRLKLYATQVVRINSIMGRLRPLVISKVTSLKNQLSYESHIYAQKGEKESFRKVQNLLNTLDVEIGKVFEGILDRT